MWGRALEELAAAAAAASAAPAASGHGAAEGRAPTATTASGTPDGCGAHGAQPTLLAAVSGGLGLQALHLHGQLLQQQELRSQEAGQGEGEGGAGAQDGDGGAGGGAGGVCTLWVHGNELARVLCGQMAAAAGLGPEGVRVSVGWPQEQQEQQQQQGSLGVFVAAGAVSARLAIGEWATALAEVRVGGRRQAAGVLGVRCGVGM